MKNDVSARLDIRGPVLTRRHPVKTASGKDRLAARSEGCWMHRACARADCFCSAGLPGLSASQSMSFSDTLTAKSQNQNLTPSFKSTHKGPRPGNQNSAKTLNPKP